MENISFRETVDGDAPAGVRQTYVWSLSDQLGRNGCLAFYAVHQQAEVYLDEELVYSLTPRPDNRIGRTVGNNWVMILLSPQDAGREVRVEVTPVYESARDRVITFYVGTQLQICLRQMKRDLPQIILSAIAIAVGTVFIVMGLYRRLRYGKERWAELIFPGLFSIIIGVWKLSDTQSSLLLFSQNPLLLSHLSAVMLLLAPAPLLMFVRRQSGKSARRLLDAACLLSIAGGMTMIVLQAANVADFRESLLAAHVSIILAAIAMAASVAFGWKRKREEGGGVIALMGLLLCVAGAFLDLLCYYIHGNSTGILYTLAAFLGYVIARGVTFSRELNHRIHTDMTTGLYNKSCCNEQFEGDVTEPTAVFMFDLNDLKRVNDTLGHDTGDSLIFQFADILRRKMPAGAFVGRYGGDEFVAVLRRADGETVRQVLKEVAAAVERYNRGDVAAPISYAVGSALSTEYPGCSMHMLLEAADTDMYEDKRRGYAESRGRPT